MSSRAENIVQTIRANFDSGKADKHRQYHKSDLEFYGWTTPDMRRLAAQQVKSVANIEELVTVCDALWQMKVFETRMIANFMLAGRVKKLAPHHFRYFYKWFRLCDGWATTDLLAIPVFGEFLRHHPQFHDDVDQWSDDTCLWVRRAGILRFITPVRHKEEWPERMEEILCAHFSDENFFIRKAIGWTLREWSKTHPRKVWLFARQHAGELSPLSFREAVRNIQDQFKKE